MSTSAPAITHTPGTHGPHILPVRVYLLVFAALMVLLAATVAAASVDFSHYHLAGHNLHFVNILIMLGVAAAKTLLVVLFFMHVKYSSRLTWLFAGAGFLWFFILVTLTMSDYLSRGWIYGTGR